MAASRPRLRLALAVGFVVAAAGARAQEEVSVQLHAFQDSRDVTVLSPTVELSKDFTDRSSLRAKFGVDAISAASDSCARCHPQGANNQRVYGSASLVRKYGDTKLSLGGEFSSERFYQAATLLTSVTRSLNKGNTTIAGGFAFSWNRPTLHPSRDTRTQLAPDVYASVTQTLAKGTVLQAGYELSYVSGYQSNPFLRTPLNGQLTVGQTPEQRTRQTLSARLRQALPADTYLEADYRHYFDDWQLTSNTLSVGLSHYFRSRELLANVTYRWYKQTGAYFYAPQYFGSPDFFTGDFRLFPFDSATYSGRLVYKPRSGLPLLPDGSSLTLEYDRYKASTDFEAAIFTAGVRVPLGGSGRRSP